MLKLIALASIILALSALIRALWREVFDAGRDAARVDRAGADLAVAKRQGEIMAEKREVEDVLDRLDRGSF
jgi:molybdopterin-guanine dinucleotide biosynthesis protein